MYPKFTINLPRPSPATISTGTHTEIRKHWVRQYQQLMNVLDSSVDSFSHHYAKKHILYMIIAGLEHDLYAQLESHKVDMTSPSEILAFINIC
jgi:hypothetical protein